MAFNMITGVIKEFGKSSVISVSPSIGHWQLVQRVN